MPDIICGKLASSFVYDCENQSTGGIAQTAKLVNKSDIDYITSVVVIDGTNHKVTTIALKPTATSFDVQAVPGKRLLSTTVTPSDTDYGMFFNHQIKFPILGMSEENMISLRDLGKGAELVAIIQDNYKGEDGKDTYKVYGWNNGLKLVEAPYDSNANNGNVPIILGSKEPDLEPNPPLIYFDTDAATTAAAYDAL